MEKVDKPFNTIKQFRNALNQIAHFFLENLLRYC